jgi:hypothetical protein
VSPYHIERWFRRASELPAEAAYASSVKKFEAATKARVVGSCGGESTLSVPKCLSLEIRVSLIDMLSNDLKKETKEVCGCDGESLCMVGPRIKVLTSHAQHVCSRCETCSLKAIPVYV